MALHRSQAQQAKLSEHTAGAIFKALADPTRLSVVEKLSAGPASMTELARSYEMALPSFAQHLSILEQSGLLRSTKQGRIRSYHLVPATLITAEDWIGKQRAIWERRLDRLESYVKDMAKEGEQPPTQRQSRSRRTKVKS